MKSTLNSIYETLLSNKTITLQFASESDFKSFYDRLRVVRSRYESKYLESIGESLCADKVIRYEKVSDDPTDHSYSIKLDIPVAQKTAKGFKIISVSDD